MANVNSGVAKKVVCSAAVCGLAGAMLGYAFCEPLVRLVADSSVAQEHFAPKTMDLVGLIYFCGMLGAAPGGIVAAVLCLRKSNPHAAGWLCLGSAGTAALTLISMLLPLMWMLLRMGLTDAGRWMVGGGMLLLGGLLLPAWYGVRLLRRAVVPEPRA